jgi:rhodanese-related sulfurtransferase/DNA-binding transcriptional ArsR family regulator
MKLNKAFVRTSRVEECRWTAWSGPGKGLTIIKYLIEYQTMSGRPVAPLYEQLSRLTRALAAPKRLELLDALAQGPRTVERLARQTSLSTANASQHLKVLRAARLVEAEKHGLFVTYRLADERVASFLVDLRRLGEEQLAELRLARERLLAAGSDGERIDRRTLVSRLKSGDAILIDVRPREEYVAGHLPDARSIPLGELRERLHELPRGTEIVAYCRGPYCMLSVEAVRLLSRRGRRARRLEDGVSEWRAAGLRVVEGAEAR